MNVFSYMSRLFGFNITNCFKLINILGLILKNLLSLFNLYIFAEFSKINPSSFKIPLSITLCFIE